MFDYFENLGYNNPYYFNANGSFLIEQKLEDLLLRLDRKRTIDPIATVELLNKNFSFGDRTIIQEISKTPWLAKPSNDHKTWDYAAIPLHGKAIDDKETIAKKFFNLICDEILDYTKEKKTVGLLLSGGMDSRMVAGALDYLLKTDQLDVEVTALTWGNRNARDVIYAERIAKILGWKWKHYTVEAKDLLNNIKVTGLRGCEYSPIHLHAIPQIRETNDLDVILAGSYGDSVGRAEYGGVHVTKLRPLNEQFVNVGNLIKNDVFRESLPIIQKDLENYHQLFPAQEQYMQNEYDYQLHYMRRQLNPCMELLNEKSNFFQIFTSPKTFRYIWSIATSLRNDDLYKLMLSYFKTDLSRIPWARTGLVYGSQKGTPDKYSKRHHSYVEIMNYQILNDIKELALSDEIKNIGFFNMSSVEELFRLTKKYPINSFYYTEKLAWIASLAVLVDTYEIQKHSKQIDDFEDSKILTKKEYMPKYYRNKLGGYLRYLKIIK